MARRAEAGIIYLFYLLTSQCVSPSPRRQPQCKERTASVASRRVDLSLLTGVSLGEQSRWRERDALLCLFFCVCTVRTIVEVFGKLLPGNSACDRAKFIHDVCLSKVLKLRPRTHEGYVVQERTLREDKDAVCC